MACTAEFYPSLKDKFHAMANDVDAYLPTIRCNTNTLRPIYNTTVSRGLGIIPTTGLLMAPKDLNHP